MNQVYSAILLFVLIATLITNSQCDPGIKKFDFSQDRGMYSSLSFVDDQHEWHWLLLEAILARSKRDAPFGEPVGIASINVKAYSNGDESINSRESNSLYGVYMGVKWQCVEYARRWLFIRKGCTFRDVNTADDMWHELKYVTRVVDRKQFPIQRYSNGSPTAPKVGTLIIYQQNSRLTVGHVAVIVNVVPGFIHIAEQNYYYDYWEHNYARRIRAEFRNGRYYIEDRFPIYGWMEVQDNNQLRPLDLSTVKAIMAQQQSSGWIGWAWIYSSFPSLCDSRTIDNNISNIKHFTVIFYEGGVLMSYPFSFFVIYPAEQ